MPKTKQLPVFPGLGDHAGRVDHVAIDVLWNPEEPGNFAMAESFLLCLGCIEEKESAKDDQEFGLTKRFEHPEYAWDSIEINKPAEQPPLPPPGIRVRFMVDDLELIEQQIKEWGKHHDTTVYTEWKDGKLLLQLPEVFLAHFEFLDYSPDAA